MELSDVLRLLAKGKWFIVVLIVVGSAAGYAATLAQTPMYRSGISIFVAVRTPDSNTAGDLGVGTGVASSKAAAYAQVITSEIVLRPVLTELGLPESTGSLAGRITAAPGKSSPIIDVTVTDPSPKRAADIANQIGATLAEVATTELDPAAPGADNPVSLSVISPAKVAASPFAPNTRTSMGLGALAGLAVGVALAFLRAALDTRVHGPRDVAQITEAPIIGAIGFDPNAKRAPLVVQASPRSPLAEAFRAMRTSLQFVGLDSATRSFAVTSAMPSEGKTTSVANLAIALAESGARVILVDADLRRPRVAEVMGIEGAVGMTDALIGRAELDDVVQQWGSGGLSVLPAGSVPPNPSELLGSAGMKALVEELGRTYDYVLFDAPPLLPVTDAAVLGAAVDGVLVATAAEKSRRAQLAAALGDLERIGVRVLGVVLTMLPAKGGDAYGYGAYGAYYGTEQPEHAPSASLAGTTRRHLRKVRAG